MWPAGRTPGAIESASWNGLSISRFVYNRTRMTRMRRIVTDQIRDDPSHPRLSVFYSGEEKESEMSSICLITGATGFVGGHLAEAAKARGLTVRTLARAGSDTALLDRLGVEICRGDLTDAEALRKAVAGVNLVFHCAAKVGDSGPIEEYRAVNVEALRTLLDAVKGRPLRRFVHLSSLGVYEARHHYATDEREPLPASHIDGYTQTKVESEKLALDYQR